MMIDTSSAFLLVPWLWILLHLNDAQVTLKLYQELRGLVPIIRQSSGGVSVISYNEDCLWNCSRVKNALVAFRFSGALTEKYCFKNCSAENGIKIEAGYTREGVTLQIKFNRLNNGSKLQADFSCAKGFEPLINGTKVENNQHQWSVSNIDSERGWFLYQILYNSPWRWAWSGLIQCGISATTKTAITTTMMATMTADTMTTTTVTTAPTTSPTTASATLPTTAPTAASTSPTTVSTTSPITAPTAPNTSSITFDTTPRTANGKPHSGNTSDNDRATFNPRVLYPSVAGVVVVLLVVCLALIFIRRRRIKKKTSDGCPTAESNSPSPALPSVRYDPEYSDVELNLPVSRKHPIVPSIPADELYAQVNKTRKLEEPHTADNLTYWSAEELPPMDSRNKMIPLAMKTRATFCLTMICMLS